MACITISTERKGTITVSASLVCPAASYPTNLFLTSEGYYLIDVEGKYIKVNTEN